MLTARSLMTGPVTAVHPCMTLPELALLFEKEDISGVPVLDDEGVLVGVVSRSDLTTTMWRHPHPRRIDPVDVEAPVQHGLASDPVPREAPDGPCDDGPALHVRDLMNPDPITVPARTPIAEVAQQMLRENVHRVLVTEGHEVIGIISSMDMVRVVAEFWRDSAQGEAFDLTDLREAC